MVPDRNTIKNWVQMFRPTASATNKKLGGRVGIVWSPENTEAVYDVIGRSLKQSGHRHSAVLNVLQLIDPGFDK